MPSPVRSGGRCCKPSELLGTGCPGLAGTKGEEGGGNIWFYTLPCTSVLTLRAFLTH